MPCVFGASVGVNQIRLLINTIAAIGDEYVRKKKANFLSEERVVTSLSGGGEEGCVVGLDAPLAQLHRGGEVDLGVQLQAEVANLARSLTITGPPLFWRDAGRPILGGQGLTTVQASCFLPSASAGSDCSLPAAYPPHRSHSCHRWEAA